MNFMSTHSKIDYAVQSVTSENVQYYCVKYLKEQ